MSFTKYKVVRASQSEKALKSVISSLDAMMKQKLSKSDLKTPHAFLGMSVPKAAAVSAWLHKHPSLEHLAKSDSSEIIDCPKGISPAQFRAFNQLYLCRNELNIKRRMLNDVKLIQSLPNEHGDLQAVLKYLSTLKSKVKDNQTALGYSLAIGAIWDSNVFIERPKILYNVMPLHSRCTVVHGQLVFYSTGETALSHGKLHFKPLHDHKLCRYTAKCFQRDISYSIWSVRHLSIHYIVSILKLRLANIAARDIDDQFTGVQNVIDPWNEHVHDKRFPQCKRKIYIRNFYQNHDMVGSKHGQIYIEHSNGKGNILQATHYTKSMFKKDLKKSLDSIVEPNQPKGQMSLF